MKKEFVYIAVRAESYVSNEDLSSCGFTAHGHMFVYNPSRAWCDSHRVCLSILVRLHNINLAS